MEKRSVLSFPELFGNIGGLYEFLATVVVFILGRYQSNAYALQQVGDHYDLAPESDERLTRKFTTMPFNLALRAQLFEPIKQTMFEQLKFLL